MICCIFYLSQPLTRKIFVLDLWIRDNAFLVEIKGQRESNVHDPFIMLALIPYHSTNSTKRLTSWLKPHDMLYIL